MPGQQLPGLTPAEAAILVPHHGAGADYHAPPRPCLLSVDANADRHNRQRQHRADAAAAIIGTHRCG
eukprot:223187-Prymnesium_polylepis.1